MNEWRKAVRATLGLDIREDYSLGNLYKKYLEIWTKRNVDLIVTIPHDTLGKMEDIVYDSFIKGTLTKDIARDIRTAYQTTKAHAKFIARDQVAKLNGQIQEAQQRSAGIEEYTWSSSLDERVRPCHQSFDREDIQMG